MRPKFRRHALAIGVLQAQPAGSLKISPAPADPRGVKLYNLFICNALACSNPNLVSSGTFYIEPRSMPQKAQIGINMQKTRQPASPPRPLAPSPAQQRTALPHHLRRIVHFRSEEHTSELQSLRHLVCRLLLE